MPILCSPVNSFTYTSYSSHTYEIQMHANAFREKHRIIQHHTIHISFMEAKSSNNSVHRDLFLTLSTKIYLPYFIECNYQTRVIQVHKDSYGKRRLY